MDPPDADWMAAFVDSPMFRSIMDWLFTNGPIVFDHLWSIAKAAGAEFLDVGKLTATDGVDGIHLSAAAHKAIGTGVGEKVKAILK